MTTGRGGAWPERIGNAIAKHVPERAWRFFTPRMFIMVGIVIAVLVLVFGVIFFPYVMMLLFAPRGGFVTVQTVSTVQAKPTLWQSQLRAVGTLHAVAGADLSSEVTGLVVKIGFKAGDDVRKGTLLVQLRDDSDRAQLAALEATATLADQTYKRDAALIKTKAISDTDYDTALANMKNARAQADAQAATVEKKAIRAPYDGRVGIRQVDVGQYVNAGQIVVTLQQLDPIYVDFDVPQQQMSLIGVGDKVSLTTDAAPGVTFSGHILAFDAKVDPNTRNVQVRATIANPDKKLLPGMFATVVVNAGAARPQITLPETAIVYNPYGDTVFVVTKQQGPQGEQLVARQRFVVLGETRGDQVAIESGLSTRDVVVSTGQLKLKNGTMVKVNNSVPLPDNPNPEPEDQ
jgi:membrane fusion protein (multidrug efflux system)